MKKIIGMLTIGQTPRDDITPMFKEILGPDYEIIEAGALDGTSGKVRLCQFHNNQHFNTDGVGMKLYRLVEQILVMGAIFYATGGDAIDVDDDGAGNKCSRLNFGPLLIDGQSTTPNGIDLQGYTDHVVIDNYQVWGVTDTAVNEGVNTTNITKGDGYES